MKHIFPVFIYVLFSVFLGQNLFSQTEEIKDYRYWENPISVRQYWIFQEDSRDKIEEIKQKWDEIGASLNTTASPFAGTFYQSGNRGYFLRWSPEKGFVYAYYYEYFIVDASYGKVKVTDSGIRFIVEKEMTGSDVSTKLSTPINWIPAYKGKYLLKESLIKSFADFYGGYNDFNAYPEKWNCECDPFAVRVGQNLRHSSVLNFLAPAKYLHYFKPPISAQIIYVGKRKISKRSIDGLSNLRISVTPVVISAGKNNGVKDGLLFVATNNKQRYLVKITKVLDKKSLGVIVREIDEKGIEVYADGWDESNKRPAYKIYSPIRAGAKLTTSTFKDFVD